MRSSQSATWWAIVRIYFDAKCAKCPKKAPKHPSQHWVVHHIDKNPNNNDPENLQLMCRSCHAKEHSNDINHPRQTDRPLILCPVCGKFGVLIVCGGKNARIYHHKTLNRKGYDCYLSKVERRSFIQNHCPEILTKRLIQKYPMEYHYRALALKKEGKTYDEIAQILQVGKRTIVMWIRGK